MIEQNYEQYYKVGQLYSITLNPINRYQYFGTKNRFRLFKNRFYEEIQSINGQHYLVIEISEPRGMKVGNDNYYGPRLHAHGVIYFKSNKQICKFLLHDYTRLLRYTSLDIDICNDKDKWHKYIHKQLLFKPDKKIYSNFIHDSADPFRDGARQGAPD